MIWFTLWLLNVVLWVWLAGFLMAMPLLARYLYRTEDSVQVGDIIFGFINCVAWFLCIEEIVDEIDDAFGIDIPSSLEKLMDYELFKFNKS